MLYAKRFKFFPVPGAEIHAEQFGFRMASFDYGQVVSVSASDIHAFYYFNVLGDFFKYVPAVRFVVVHDSQAACRAGDNFFINHNKKNVERINSRNKPMGLPLFMSAGHYAIKTEAMKK